MHMHGCILVVALPERYTEDLHCKTLLHSKIIENDEIIYFKENHGLTLLLDTSNDTEVFP